MKSLYELKLHETAGFDQHVITRVPGGWLYRQAYSCTLPPVFVPFSDEFSPDKIKG